MAFDGSAAQSRLQVNIALDQTVSSKCSPHQSCRDGMFSQCTPHIFVIAGNNLAVAVLGDCCYILRMDMFAHDGSAVHGQRFLTSHCESNNECMFRWASAEEQTARPLSVLHICSTSFISCEMLDISSKGANAQMHPMQCAHTCMRAHTRMHAYAPYAYCSSPIGVPAHRHEHM